MTPPFQSGKVSRVHLAVSCGVWFHLSLEASAVDNGNTWLRIVEHARFLPFFESPYHSKNNNAVNAFGQSALRKKKSMDVSIGCAVMG